MTERDRQDSRSIAEFIPDTKAGKCIRYCFDELGLSVEETSSVLYDASKIAQAIRLLTDGKLTSEHPS
jgi:hypothetical protein